MKIEELFIKNDSNTPPWYFFNLCDPIDVKHSVENCDARQIETFPLNLSNLKRLKVTSKWDRNESEAHFMKTVTMTPLYIYVHDVNKFTQLEQLRLDGISVAGRDNRILRLPKLKILDLWRGNGLTMDVPCLKSLNTYQLNMVNLVDPKTVEFIKTYSIENADEVLAAYEGVTRLKVDNVLDLLNHSTILQSLPNLQMFDGDQDSKYRSEREAYYYTYKYVKKLYNRLIKQKEKLGRHGLKICFGQIEIENGKRFEDYGDFRDYFDC